MSYNYNNYNKVWKDGPKLKSWKFIFLPFVLHLCIICLSVIMKCTMCIKINCNEYTKLLIVSDHSITIPVIVLKTSLIFFKKQGWTSPLALLSRTSESADQASAWPTQVARSIVRLSYTCYILVMTLSNGQHRKIKAIIRIPLLGVKMHIIKVTFWILEKWTIGLGK